MSWLIEWVVSNVSWGRAQDRGEGGGEEGGGGRSYINIIIQLNPTRAVQLDLLERLPHNIIRLPLGGLRSLEDSRLV
jgi:hypothetical protein